MNFIVSTKNSIDKKAALINALGWNNRGRNATIYFAMLKKKYGIEGQGDSNKYDLFTADELFCLGYLLVMDDYFHPERAIGILKKAREKNKKSFTVAMILALTEAQKAMQSDWCKVWRVTESVLNNENLNQDLRESAKEIIIKYMKLYKKECK